MMYNEIDEIKALAEIMRDCGLTALKLRLDDDCLISLKRGGEAAPRAAAPAPSAPAAGNEAPTAPEIKDGTPVKSPMVGVFYSAPSPEEQPFVRVGDKVRKGDVLCIVEAMKLMNEIAAEQDGEIVEICAEDGALVEYGQTLFIIK